MSDDHDEPRLPALAPGPPDRPRTVFRISVGPSPELLRVMNEHPGGKLTIRMPGDPDYDATPGPIEGPAFALQSWIEDNHACAKCGAAFAVAYGNPPGQSSERHNVAVRCPSCGGDVGVSVPRNLDRGDLQIKG